MIERIVLPSSCDLSGLAGELVRIPAATGCDAAKTAVLRVAEWRSASFDPVPLDAAIGDLALAGPVALVIDDDGERGAPLRARDGIERDVVEMIGRYQRFVDGRNEASATPAFEALLARHRALHDLARPLVRADYEHALDAWQWVLRLDRDAGFAVQAAALCHDLERLESEALARVEHRASDYQAFKDGHARGSARLVRALLAGLPVDARVAARAVDLVARHERPDADPELALLNDADALSFFNANACGYVAYFGLEQARKKVAWTLGRLSPARRRRLEQIRLRADVAALVREALEGAGKAA